jgi:hypothetical protein
MIKKLICYLWGHKTVHKAYTGQKVNCVGLMGNKYTISLYKFERTNFCTRCGKTIKEETVCSKKIRKSLDQIMNIEFLAKYLLVWGIAINVVIISLLLTRLIRIIAGL